MTYIYIKINKREVKVKINFIDYFFCLFQRLNLISK